MLKRMLARLLVMALSLFGCSPTQGNRLDKINAWMNREKYCVAECVEQLIPALQSQDAAAVLALFSENTRKAQPDLEARIGEMLARLDGGFVWHLDENYSGGGETHYGMRMEYSDFDIGIVSRGHAYELRSRLTWEHNRDAGELGLRAMLFIPVESYDALEHFYFLDEDQGLTVVPETPGAPEGCFIGGFPAVWLDRDAPAVTEEALLDFLTNKTTVTRSEFEDSFGPPAVKLCKLHDSVGYVLPDVDGEPRFAMLHYNYPDELWTLWVEDQWTTNYPAIWSSEKT